LEVNKKSEEMTRDKFQLWRKLSVLIERHTFLGLALSHSVQKKIADQLTIQGTIISQQIAAKSEAQSLFVAIIFI
jgi:hypothetical protein